MKKDSSVQTEMGKTSEPGAQRTVRQLKPGCKRLKSTPGPGGGGGFGLGSLRGQEPLQSRRGRYLSKHF